MVLRVQRERRRVSVDPRACCEHTLQLIKGRSSSDAVVLTHHERLRQRLVGLCQYCTQCRKPLTRAVLSPGSCTRSCTASARTTHSSIITVRLARYSEGEESADGPGTSWFYVLDNIVRIPVSVFFGLRAWKMVGRSKLFGGIIVFLLYALSCRLVVLKR